MSTGIRSSSSARSARSAALMSSAMRLRCCTRSTSTSRSACSGRRLVICGIVQDERYFADAVEPHVDGDQVIFLGSVGPQRRADVLGDAAALLHPIYFDEPFGLSVVEAMACGTPVVAYRRGSMPEVVDEGVTGYLAHDIESSVDAVRAAVRLGPSGGPAPAGSRVGGGRQGWGY